MKQVLFGIFAHPDDEGFGPSGTLIKMALDGVDIHLICLTRGEAGTNSDNYNDLGTVRYNEWQAAGKLIGAKSMKQFNFGDGQLCNAQFHDIANSVETYIKTKLDEYQEPTSVEFLTLDMNGLTGHIDHITASMITGYIFTRLTQQRAHHLKQVRYFCLPPTPLDNDVSFVFWPAGRNKNYIDEAIDVSDVYETKLAVMKAHHSQRKDADLWLSQGDLIKQESFYFLKPTVQES